MQGSKGKGFTIVELITVILLLAILSGVAISRMVEPRAFAPSTIAHQLELEFSLAHGEATRRQDATTTLALLGQADAWLIRLSNDVDGVIRETRVDALEATIAVTHGALSISLTDTDVLSLTYSGTGEVVSASLGGSAIDPRTGIQIDISGQSARTLCLYATGHLDDAACA